MGSNGDTSRNRGIFYPLALPLATIGLLWRASGAMQKSLRTASLKVADTLLFLVLSLSPSIDSSMSGSFLLPWWLQFASGSKNATYYPGTYFRTCLGLLAAFLIARIYHPRFTKNSPTRWNRQRRLGALLCRQSNPIRQGVGLKASSMR